MRVKYLISLFLTTVLLACSSYGDGFSTKLSKNANHGDSSNNYTSNHPARYRAAKMTITTDNDVIIDSKENLIIENAR